MTVDTAQPSVFDAGLPTLSYDVTESPQEMYPQIREALRSHRSRWGHWDLK